MKQRIAWAPVIERAAAIVRSYRTAVTLRQVFYRLVSEEAIPNTENAYKRLSRLTARARRAGTFPPLADATREIWHNSGWTSPQHAIRDLADQYRRPRDEHQRWQLWIAYEKRTLTAQVRDWFGDYGPRFVALAGYESETLDRQITTNVQQDGRPAVVVYAGDLDPSGEDIWRSFLKHTGRLWHQTQRVAVTWEQVETHQLPVLPDKTTDSRARTFTKTRGQLAQIEVEALDPNTLHNIYTQAISPYIDLTTWNQVIQAEQADRQTLTRLADDSL